MKLSQPVFFIFGILLFVSAMYKPVSSHFIRGVS